MLDDIRQAAARQRSLRAMRRMVADCKRLLSGDVEMGGMAVASELIGRLQDLANDSPEAMDGLLGFLAGELSPDPAAVLRAA